VELKPLQERRLREGLRSWYTDLRAKNTCDEFTRWAQAYTEKASGPPAKKRWGTLSYSNNEGHEPISS